MANSVAIITAPDVIVAPAGTTYGSGSDGSFLDTLTATNPSVNNYALVPNNSQITMQWSFSQFIMPPNSQVRGVAWLGHILTPLPCYTLAVGQLTFVTNPVTPLVPGAPGVSAESSTSTIYNAGYDTTLIGTYLDLSSLNLTDADWNAPQAGQNVTLTTSADDTYSGNPAQNLQYFGPWQLDVYYNQAPSATNVTIAGTTGAVTGGTAQPTVSWTYTDPENDPQAAFTVSVYAGPNQTAGTTTEAPLYTSGPIFGNASSFQIPQGVITNGSTVTIQVLVSDQGSNGRYSDNKGGTINYTYTYIGLPPLMPAFTPQFALPPSAQSSLVFDKKSGGIPYLYAQARGNALTLGDSLSFTNWLFSNYNQQPIVLGSSRITGTAATTANLIIESPHVPIIPSTFYTGIITVATNAPATRLIQVSLVFYNASGLNVGSATRNNYIPASSGGTKCWMLSWAGPSVINGYTFLYVQVPGALAGETYTFTFPSVTNGALNLLDNSNFGSALAHWQNGSVALNTPVSTIDGDEQDLSGGASVALGGSAYLAQGPISIQDTKFIMSASVEFSDVGSYGGEPYGTGTYGGVVPGAGTVPPVALSVTTSPGTNTAPSGVGVSTLTHETALNVWNHEAQLVDATTSTNAFAFVQAEISSSGSVTNICLEPVLPLVNVSFANGTPGQPLPLIIPLATTDTIGWFDDSGNTTATASWENTNLSAGSTVALYLNPGTSPASAAQIFSVAGYTSLTLGVAFYLSATGTSAMTVYFFGPGGEQLNVVENGLTVGNYTFATNIALNAWTNTGIRNLAIPVGASLCKIRFYTSANAPVAYDSLTVQFNGSANASPYLDGGWSQGIKEIPILMSLLRSADNGATWQNVRPVRGGTNVQTASQIELTGFPYSIIYSDYEYPPLPADMVDTSTTRLLYKSILVAHNPDGFVTGIQSPTRSFYRALYSDWTLTDPTNTANYIVLQVKSFKATTTEQLVKNSGLGRSRVVVIGDTVQGEVVTLNLLSFSSVDNAAYRAHYDSQKTLVLRSPDGEQWYVRATARSRTRTWTGSYQRQLRPHTIELQEVDPLP